MFDYTGYECKACGNKFGQDDDIVVCPECGTPYHRECYLKNGKCVNVELHEKKTSWKSSIQTKAEGELKCRRCANTLRSDQLYCDRCGAPTDYLLKSGLQEQSDRMSENGDQNIYGSNGQDSGIDRSFNPYLINFSDPLCGFNPEEDCGDGLTMRDIGNFVKTNTHYYLPKFKLMKTGRFKLSLNIPAMFFPEIYFANRKMVLAAALVLILRTVVELPAAAVSMQMMLGDERTLQMFLQTFPALTGYVEQFMSLNLNTDLFNMLYNFSNVINWVMIFVFGSLSNYFYYRFTISRAAKIKSVSPSLGCAERLRESGGTSGGIMAVFIALYFVVRYVSMGAVLLLLQP